MASSTKRKTILMGGTVLPTTPDLGSGGER